MPREFVHTERVRFGDLDANRHLNNVVFLRYFETARINFARDLLPEHDPARHASESSGLIFAECHINYRSPVMFDELVEVTCWVGEVRRSAARIDFRMTVEDRTAAEGYGWLVGFDYAAQRSSPLSDATRARFEEAAA